MVLHTKGSSKCNYEMISWILIILSSQQTQQTNKKQFSLFQNLCLKEYQTHTAMVLSFTALWDSVVNSLMTEINKGNYLILLISR